MPAIRAVIVDDEPPARARLRHLLEQAGGVSVVGEAGNADDARLIVRDRQPDVVFLDIEMPEVRGTSLAASLPEPRPFIVFATAYERYALDAFALEATDYLLKPVSRTKLAGTLARVRGRLESRTDVERDVAAASALQARMWPGALPAIPGFDAAAASLPAQGVGGDFYDAFHLAGAQWGLLLGDVSGKGVAAGLVATAVQGRVQTAGRHAGLAPADLATALNHDVFASTGGQRYATLVYGVIHAGGHEMQLVNAGHPPGLLFAPGLEEPIEIPPTGPALGLMEAARFDAGCVTMPRGSVLYLYTDGVSEALDEADVEFGAGGVVAVAAAVRDRPASSQCAALLDAVRRHRGARQDQDDVTVMVVRRN